MKYAGNSNDPYLDKDFREGNGRTQREFIGQLAQAAGHRIDWSGINQEDMTQASIEAYNGDSSGLAGLIRAGLADSSSFEVSCK